MTALLREVFRYTGRIPGRSKRSRCEAATEARLRRSPHTPQGGPQSATRQMSRCQRPLLKDEGFAIQPDALPIYIRNFAETRVILHRVDQHRHDVARSAARLGQLLEPPLHLD